MPAENSPAENSPRRGRASVVNRRQWLSVRYDLRNRGGFGAPVIDVGAALVHESTVDEANEDTDMKGQPNPTHQSSRRTMIALDRRSQ